MIPDPASWCYGFNHIPTSDSEPYLNGLVWTEKLALDPSLSLTVRFSGVLSVEYSPVSTRPVSPGWFPPHIAGGPVIFPNGFSTLESNFLAYLACFPVNIPFTLDMAHTVAKVTPEPASTPPLPIFPNGFSAAELEYITVIVNEIFYDLSPLMKQQMAYYGLPVNPDVAVNTVPTYSTTNSVITSATLPVGLGTGLSFTISGPEPTVREFLMKTLSIIK